MRLKMRVMAIALISILPLLFILWLALNVQLLPIPTQPRRYIMKDIIVVPSFVTPTPVSTPTAPPAPASGDNTAIPVALIGLIGVLAAALIGGAVTVYITIYQGKQKAQKGTEKATRESDKATTNTNTPDQPSF